MKKANHQANIVRITEIKTHTNADTLEIILIGEYQVVSKKGQFHVGDLAVYIQPDSVVPQTEPFRFIWQPYLDNIANDPAHCKHVTKSGTDAIVIVDDMIGYGVCQLCQLHLLQGEPIIPEKKRRITVRKFRGEWSEGLLLPVSDFDEFIDKVTDVTRSGVGSHDSFFWEGDDVSDLLKITHYDPDAGKEEGSDEFAPKTKKKKYPKTLRGWIGLILSKIRFWRSKQFIEETDSLGIPVYDVDALKNYKNTFIEGEKVRVTEKIHGSNARFIFLDGTFYVGSRNKWTAPGSSNPFRNAAKANPWIEEWCREHEGYVLWGEVTPTQKGFDYGSKEPQFFVFDIRGLDGKWLEDNHEFRVQLQAHSVPLLYKGPYNETVKTFVDGPSKLGKHIREGCVVTVIPERHVRGLGRAQLKVVSNAFLEKDSK